MLDALALDISHDVYGDVLAVGWLSHSYSSCRSLATLDPSFFFFVYSLGKGVWENVLDTHILGQLVGSAYQKYKRALRTVKQTSPLRHRDSLNLS